MVLEIKPGLFLLFAKAQLIPMIQSIGGLQDQRTFTCKVCRALQSTTNFVVRHAQLQVDPD